MGEELVVKFSGDAAQLNGVLSGVQKGFSGLGGLVTTALGVGLGNVITAGLATAKDAVGAFFGDMIQGANEAQDIQAQLANVLKSTGGAAGWTADMANDLATALSQVSRFEDDTIVSGENLLLTFTNIGKDVFPQATETMLDMSQALGQDLKSSAIQLGKALNDPITGVSALQRVGVTFNATQKETIKTMVESGDVMGAQKVILQELQKEFGGAAKAAGETFAGKTDILVNKLGNLKESLGTAVTGALGTFQDKLITALDDPRVQKGVDALGALVQDLADLATGQGSIENLAGDLGALGGALGLDPVAIQAAVMQLGDLAWQAKDLAQQWLPQLQEKATEVFSGAQKAIGDFWTDVQPKLGDFKRWLEVEVPPALDIFFRKMGELQQTHDQWVLLWGEMKDSATGATSDINADVGLKMPTLAETVGNSMDSLNANMKMKLDLTRGIWLGVQDLMRGDFEGWGRQMGDTEWKVLTDLVNMAGIKTTDLRQDFINAFTGILGDSTAWLNDLANNIQVNLTNLGLAATQTLSGWRESFRMTAGDVMGGLIDGFWDSAAAVQQALSDIINAAIQAIKDQLGIHSHSTVGRSIGADLALGISDGFAGVALNWQPSLNAALPVSAGAPTAPALAPGGGAPIVFQFHIEHADFSSPAAAEQEARTVSVLAAARLRGMLPVTG